jgi:hypothetical protein
VEVKVGSTTLAAEPTPSLIQHFPQVLKQCCAFGLEPHLKVTKGDGPSVSHRREITQHLFFHFSTDLTSTEISRSIVGLKVIDKYRSKNANLYENDTKHQRHACGQEPDAT